MKDHGNNTIHEPGIKALMQTAMLIVPAACPDGNENLSSENGLEKVVVGGLDLR